MLLDSLGRTINYLRISVTDKCNYRCTYCMPEYGVMEKSHNDMLSYEEIAQITGIAGELGIRKIRLTGGEPLIKRNIETLVQLIADSYNFDEITMTTNGSLLTPGLAKKLANAGLNRVNISFDTLNPKKFNNLTRCGTLSDVVNGIQSAKEADLNPIKINMVIFNTTTQDEIDKMQSFCNFHKLTLQKIRHFELQDHGYKTHDTECDRPLPCHLCNRLRLTADGFLKSCLFSDDEIKVNMNTTKEDILMAVNTKQARGKSCSNRYMMEIGG